MDYRRGRTRRIKQNKKPPEENRISQPSLEATLERRTEYPRVCVLVALLYCSLCGLHTYLSNNDGTIAHLSFDFVSQKRP